MIDRDYNGGPIVLRCDACAGGYLETEETTATAAMATASDEGWTRRHQDGDWNHFCPDCSEDRAWQGIRSAASRSGKEARR